MTSIFDHKPEDDAEAIFGVEREVPPDPVAISVRAYIIARYARVVLTNELARFEGGKIDVKYPDTYSTRIRAALADITADLHDMRGYFRANNVRVPAEPDDSYYGGVTFTYWCAGRSSVASWTVPVMRRDVKRSVNRYFNGGHDG